MARCPLLAQNEVSLTVAVQANQDGIGSSRETDRLARVGDFLTVDIDGSGADDLVGITRFVASIVFSRLTEVQGGGAYLRGDYCRPQIVMSDTLFGLQ